MTFGANPAGGHDTTQARQPRYNIEARMVMQLFTPIRHRLPSSADMLLVFGGCAFGIHLWALFNLFYILPGWLLRMDVGELVGAIAYVLSFSLLESLVVWAGLTLAAVFLPQGWLGKHFLAKSMSLFLITTLFAIIFQFNYALLATNRIVLAGAVFLYLVLAVGLNRIAGRSPALENTWRKALQMAIVPSAIYVVFDLLGVLVISYRNIF